MLEKIPNCRRETMWTLIIVEQGKAGYQIENLTNSKPLIGSLASAKYN